MTRSATPALTFPRANILGQFVRSILIVTKAFGDRRAVMNLSDLDDRMLQDIGLVRSDVDSALAEPVFRNPSRVLVRCAKEHMRAELAASSARRVRPVVPIATRGRR